MSRAELPASDAHFAGIVACVRREFANDGFIPLHAPIFVGNEKRYLLECIDSGFVSSVGEFVDRFESMFAQYTGAPRAVAVVNGTAALHASLRLCGVQPGDIVLTQSFTFVATSNAIAHAQALPLYLDVDRDTLGLSPVALREYLSTRTERRAGGCFDRASGRRIAACVPVHIFGLPGRIEEVVEACSGCGIDVVEDCAESLGSYVGGVHTGLFGRLGAFSFNGNKTLTTGGGGMIVTRDAALGARAKHLTTTAKLPHRWAYVHDEVGFNYRMPNVNAALGCAQMETLPQFLADKRRLADAYRAFCGERGIACLGERAGCTANYWLNAIVLADRAQRDRFLGYTNDQGVMTRPAWELNHRLAMYADCPRGDLANSEWMEERVVNLPSSARPRAAG
jgi:aminotransferase in exopolysaccharide biosynthesis